MIYHLSSIRENRKHRDYLIFITECLDQADVGLTTRHVHVLLLRRYLKQEMINHIAIPDVLLLKSCSFSSLLRTEQTFIIGVCPLRPGL